MQTVLNNLNHNSQCVRKLQYRVSLKIDACVLQIKKIYIARYNEHQEL